MGPASKVARKENRNERVILCLLRSVIVQLLEIDEKRRGRRQERRKTEEGGGGGGKKRERG